MARTNNVTELAQHSTDPNVVTFEQPLTERMRTFLRIEFLHAQTGYHAENLRGFGARAAVTSLLELMTILGRGDVRADVLKELEQHAAMLTNYVRQPGIDHARLESLLGDVTGLKTAIAGSGPQFMNSLKECEFLNTIKHRSSIPGGTGVFDLPDYAYWLRLPYDERVAEFAQWINVLEPICAAVAELLWLTREATEPVEHVAPEGLYQHHMDRQTQANLVRVIIPRGTGYYPEISAGRHRVTVRFVQWQGVNLRPAQIDEDVEFLLALN
ncbi:MAG: cell division protein ZapD [Gammaproteobacteria bacterium]|nr:cell division protein ZapD [Gammaproteobacteria bacterium]